MEFLKLWLRILDAVLCARVSPIRFRNHSLRSFRPLAWPESGQGWFDQEIAPYFLENVWGKKYEAILDAGSAQGLFSIAARKIQPQARLMALEPSLRQRILMRKNFLLNRIQRNYEVAPCALWNEPQPLAFRTHGALSSLAQTQQLPDSLSFGETIQGVRLDDWLRFREIGGPILIKMDIEGAEIEALQGAEKMLTVHKPALLVQAYHLRGRERTLERVQRYLGKLGIDSRESEITPGLLVANGC